MRRTAARVFVAWLGMAGVGVVMTGGLEAATAGPAPQTVSVEGCLRSGSADGEYIVSTGGERHTAMASPGVTLDDHVNHRVELTGALTQQSIGPVFVVTGVRTLAASCTTTR